MCVNCLFSCNSFAWILEIADYIQQGGDSAFYCLSSTELDKGSLLPICYYLILTVIQDYEKFAEKTKDFSETLARVILSEICSSMLDEK